MQQDLKCETCRFWDRDHEGSFSGTCRRYAARPIVRPVPEGEEDVPSVETFWPRSDHDQFCGEWVDHG